MLKIKKNPNTKIYLQITKKVKENHNYCPCSLIKSPETICPCKEFRGQDYEGECHCGRFVKIDE